MTCEATTEESPCWSLLRRGFRHTRDAATPSVASPVTNSSSCPRAYELRPTPSRFAEHTLSSFNAPFILDGEEVHVTASVGIAIGQAGESGDKLLRDADLAMHRAKDRGQARYEVFDETLRAEAERDLGCHYAQGYFFARPCSFEECVEYLAGVRN
jgi:predicted signal transduction protein with EAL and GGDEF domain